MRVLITGSTGFVGRHLVPKLLNESHGVLEITRDLNKSICLYSNSTSKYLYRPDDQDGLRAAIKDFNPEVVIHLASYLTSLDDYSVLLELLNTNIIFFSCILDALKGVDLKLFINTGTFAEFSKSDGLFDPAYLYAATKTASRSFLNYYSKICNFKQITVVPYTIYGGIDTRKKVIDTIYDSLDRKEPIDMTAGEQILDFVHIDDVTDFYLFLINRFKDMSNNLNVHLGTGVGTNLRQLAKIFENKTGKIANINWGRKPYRPLDVMYAVVDKKSFDSCFNWRPIVSIELGIDKYLNSVKIS